MLIANTHGQLWGTRTPKEQHAIDRVVRTQKPHYFTNERGERRVARPRVDGAVELSDSQIGRIRDA